MTTDNMAEMMKEAREIAEASVARQSAIKARFRGIIPDDMEIVKSVPKVVINNMTEEPFPARAVLNWQDVRQIIQIADRLDPLHSADQRLAEFQTDQSFYTEVLKRFQEGRP